MKVFVAVFVLCLAAQRTWASGAGRAFPLESENLAIVLFQTVNPYLEWDSTNFLVDLSGNYANCQWVHHQGFEQVDRPSPEGDSITAIVDHTYGEGMDVDAVNAYIAYVLEPWMRNPDYVFLMRGATKFGCSVRPGCGGEVSVACAFSPGGRGPDPTIPNPTGKQNALAFTKDQYYDAERITNNRWDRSNYLENLSGYETSCSMIGKPQWSFPKAKAIAGERDQVVLGLFGYTPNMGETEPAIEEILASFKHIDAKEVGCSVIPDCYTNRGDTNIMWVVVSCIYEEK